MPLHRVPALHDSDVALWAQGSRGPPAQVYEALLDRILQRLRHPRCVHSLLSLSRLALTAPAGFCYTRVICLARKLRRCWRVRDTRAPGVAAGS